MNPFSIEMEARRYPGVRARINAFLLYHEEGIRALTFFFAVLAFGAFCFALALV